MILRVFLSVMFFYGSLSVCFAMSPAELAQAGKYDEAVSAYKKAVAGEPDAKKKALMSKELGDLFVSREDFRNAADQYVAALSYSRDFTEQERQLMATRMSWGGRFEKAIGELNSIVRENPANYEARIQLARTLSWNGDLKGAIREADTVLRVFPQNRDALLVKASALKWQGRTNESLVIYRKILQEGEDFDTRLGYAYAQMANGDRRGARESASMLKPAFPYQKKEVENLLTELDRRTRPRIDTWYSYYNDTDDNRLNRVGLRYGQSVGNWDLGFYFRHTDAKDNNLRNWAQDYGITAYTKVTESLGLGGGVGLSPVGDGGTNYFVTGNVRGDFAVGNGMVGIGLAREVFSDTAEIIENRIRVNSARVQTTQRLTDRISLFGSYQYRDYSDDNNAHDFQIAPSYRLLTGTPAISVGYRFRYMNFDRQSLGGYFDPNDFMSHQLFSTISMEKGKFSAYLEPYIGVQSFRRYGDDSTDLIGGVYGSLGYQIAKNLRLEINGEYGNSAAESASGFEYYMIGAGLGLTF